MAVASHARSARSPFYVSALAAFGLAWSQSASAVAVPVLYVSVDGGPEVSFENDQVCDGTKAVICLGTGATGDLIISSWELSADPDPYLAGSFNFYNASLTNTISVVATVIFPMSGTFASPDLTLDTGLLNNIFGGGLLNLVVEGIIDPPASPLLAISEVSPGVPLSVCDDPGADPSCQGVTSVSLSQSGPPSLSVLTAIGLRLSFDLSPDTVATIGLDPGEPYNGGAYLEIVPQAAVPVPAAAWLLASGLGVLGALRRRAR